jgi:hypothetical protein
MDTFNLEHYRALRGHFNLDDLRLFVEKALLRLGGAILPEGETFRIEVPEVLQSYPNISRSYSGVTFDRNLAMRRRNTQLLGLGHPLVDALIAHFQSAGVRGEVTALPNGTPNTLSVRCIFITDIGNEPPRREYRNFVVTLDGGWTEASPRTDVIALGDTSLRLLQSLPFAVSASLRERIESGIASIEASIRAKSEEVAVVRGRVVGMAQFYNAASETRQK